MMLLYLTPQAYEYDVRKVDLNIVREVVFHRNYLAAVLARRRQTLREGVIRGPVLPPRPFLPHERPCSTCFVRDKCFLLAANLEGDEAAPAETDNYIRSYFQKWISALDAEATVVMENREQIWVP